MSKELKRVLEDITARTPPLTKTNQSRKSPTSIAINPNLRCQRIYPALTYQTQQTAGCEKREVGEAGLLRLLWQGLLRDRQDRLSRGLETLKRRLWLRRGLRHESYCSTPSRGVQ